MIIHSQIQSKLKYVIAWFLILYKFLFTCFKKEILGTILFLEIKRKLGFIIKKVKSVFQADIQYRTWNTYLPHNSKLVNFYLWIKSTLCKRMPLLFKSDTKLHTHDLLPKKHPVTALIIWNFYLSHFNDALKLCVARYIWF